MNVKILNISYFGKVVCKNIFKISFIIIIFDYIIKYIFIYIDLNSDFMYFLRDIFPTM